MLPDTDRLKFDLYQHEIMCADIFTAYWGTFTHWGVPRSETLERLQLKPDRYVRFGEAEFFLEADRGSEGTSILRSKIEKYERYSQNLKRPFHVIFVVQDYCKDLSVKFIKDPAEKEATRLDKQKKRGEAIAGLIQEARTGEMCLFTCVDWITNHPTNSILASPLGAVYSFDELANRYQ
ncbi:MAG TPA: replication-relaxation family protein [Blastocatellia bacterium]|nr:replication-relaxation family protein [Blastocatellia bacterium]